MCAHTHTEIYVIIAFPLQQLIANTPQCYVIRTLPVLLNNLVNEFINASLLFFNIITFSVALCYAIKEGKRIL